VESVQKSDLDQVGGPDHGSGVNEVATENTSHTETKHLGAVDEKEVGQKAKILTVVNLLDDSDIDGVSGTGGTVGSESDQDVLLDAERTGVQATFRQNASHEFSDGVSQKLDDQGRDGHGLGAEPAML